MVYGVKRDSGKVQLGSGEDGELFQPGSTDEIQVIFYLTDKRISFISLICRGWDFLLDKNSLMLLC